MYAGVLDRCIRSRSHYAVLLDDIGAPAALRISAISDKTFIRQPRLSSESGVAVVSQVSLR